MKNPRIKQLWRLLKEGNANILLALKSLKASIHSDTGTRQQQIEVLESRLIKTNAYTEELLAHVLGKLEEPIASPGESNSSSTPRSFCLPLNNLAAEASMQAFFAGLSEMIKSVAPKPKSNPYPKPEYPKIRWEPRMKAEALLNTGPLASKINHLRIKIVTNQQKIDEANGEWRKAKEELENSKEGTLVGALRKSSLSFIETHLDKLLKEGHDLQSDLDTLEAELKKANEKKPEEPKAKEPTLYEKIELKKLDIAKLKANWLQSRRTGMPSANEWREQMKAAQRELSKLQTEYYSKPLYMQMIGRTPQPFFTPEIVFLFGLNNFDA